MMTGPVVTYSALTTLASQKRAEKLARLVEGTDPAPIGVGVFLIEDGSGWCEVGAYFSDKPDDLALDLLAAAVGARPFVISEVPDQDWVAHVRRELSPVIAGRFFVHGAHDAGEVPSGAVALKIEASMAFGTGHHGTTLGCLSAFDELLTAGGRPKSIADIGCGTAILAMAAAKSLADALIVAGDIDAVAVDVARATIAANHLSERVTCVQASGFDHPLIRSAGPFDLIFANILKGPLITLAQDMYRHTSAGGTLILSGILADQAPDVIETYQMCGYNLTGRREIVHWTTLNFGKI